MTHLENYDPEKSPLTTIKQFHHTEFNLNSSWSDEWHTFEQHSPLFDFNPDGDRATVQPSKENMT